MLMFVVGLGLSSFIGDLEILLMMLSKAVKLDFFGSSLSGDTNGIVGVSAKHDILGSWMGSGILLSCMGMEEMSLISKLISFVEKESNNLAKISSFSRLSLWKIPKFLFLFIILNKFLQFSNISDTVGGPLLNWWNVKACSRSLNLIITRRLTSLLAD